MPLSATGPRRAAPEPYQSGIQVTGTDLVVDSAFMLSLDSPSPSVSILHGGHGESPHAICSSEEACLPLRGGLRELLYQTVQGRGTAEYSTLPVEYHTESDVGGSMVICQWLS